MRRLGSVLVLLTACSMGQAAIIQYDGELGGLLSPRIGDLTAGPVSAEFSFKLDDASETPNEIFDGTLSLAAGETYELELSGVFLPAAEEFGFLAGDGISFLSGNDELSLFVRDATSTAQILWTDVAYEATPIPEPKSTAFALILMVVGLVVVAGPRRVKQ